MGCSAFAKRAMIPALLECNCMKLIAVASRTKDRAAEFAGLFGCEAVEGYRSLLDRTDIDAIYMPLPTGLHRNWAHEVLLSGKHLLVEKSFTENYDSAVAITKAARERDLLVMENYCFLQHAQLKWLSDFITSGELGEIHLLRSTFGFPPLEKGNFRYNKNLGGGALLDAGGYPIRIARLILGDDMRLVGAALEYDDELGVDIYGDAMFQSNHNGMIAQISFGFDYYYQCMVELLGTKGKLSMNRIFTAPPGLAPCAYIEYQSKKIQKSLSADNQYVNTIDYFARAIRNPQEFETHLNSILSQSRVQQEIRLGKTDIA